MLIMADRRSFSSPSYLQILFLWSLSAIVASAQHLFVRECTRTAGLPTCACQTDNGVVDLRQISRSSGAPT